MSLAVNLTKYSGCPQKGLKGAMVSESVYSAPSGGHWPRSLLQHSPVKTTIAQLKPSSPNGSFQKLLQQYPKPVFPRRAWYMLFFLTKPISDIKNKNKNKKPKEKDKKADFFLPKIEWRSPPSCHEDFKM